MNRLLAFVSAPAAALTLTAAPASGVVLKTNWVEKLDTSSGGAYTLYVRRIEITKARWSAAVGITNGSRATMHLQYGKVQEGPRSVFYRGPGIWWDGARAVQATSTKPGALPHSLGPRKSWFATISGPTAKLPAGLLLRIGFAFFVRDGQQYPTEISTTHQFRLPKGIR